MLKTAKETLLLEFKSLLKHAKNRLKKGSKLKHERKTGIYVQRDGFQDEKC